jgi:hypothetical protein
VGLWGASLALLVNTPRLILAYLAADGLALAEGWRAAMLTVSAVATGIVLTGGNAYLAHAVARRRRLSLITIWGLGPSLYSGSCHPAARRDVGEGTGPDHPFSHWPVELVGGRCSFR